MTRFNIAALQEQGMSQAEIDAYIREKEAAIYGPKAGGGTGYDIGSPMPGPAIQTPGATRPDLNKPTLEDLGKPNTGPRPPKIEEVEIDYFNNPKPSSGGNQPDRSIPESGDFQNLLDKRKKRKEQEPQETPNSRIPKKKTAKLEQMVGEEGGSRFQKMLDRIKQISG
jgi:hypothetical protein